MMNSCNASVHYCVNISPSRLGVLIFAEVGMRNFFLNPQLQFCNLKKALPQSQFRNF